jgi:hypothetical protein
MEEFVKHDHGKTEYHLIPPLAEEEMARVLMFGAEKYAPNNWKKTPDLKRYYNAARRHMALWLKGEQFDSETGKHHLAHAMCCLAFVAELELEGRLK